MSWSKTESNPPRGNPVAAVWMTWLVPGLGHATLGRPLFGLIAFLVVQAVYLLGLRLSDGMGFEYLDLDLRSVASGALTPEVGNLSGLVYHLTHFGFGPGFPRPWPEHIELGVWLTASSGMLNAVLMVHANHVARLPQDVESREPSPATCVLAGWLVPGLGHWLLGRRLRALVVFLLLVGLFLGGTWMAGGSNLDRERHFYYWSGQFLVGAPAMIGEWVNGHAPLARDLAYADAGLVFACLAGLLNILCLLDVQAQAEAACATPGAAPPTRPSSDPVQNSTAARSAGGSATP